MALGLKDLKQGRKKNAVQNSSYKRKNLRPWESYNAFESTKTQTIRAHEAVLKAQKRSQSSFDQEINEEKVRDDIYGEKVFRTPDEKLPLAQNFNVTEPINQNLTSASVLETDFKLDNQNIKDLSLLPKKEKAIFTDYKGSFFDFIRFILE